MFSYRSGGQEPRIHSSGQSWFLLEAPGENPCPCLFRFQGPPAFLGLWPLPPSRLLLLLSHLLLLFVTSLATSALDDTCDDIGPPDKQFLSHLKILVLITAESLLPSKITCTGSTDWDTDIFGGYYSTNTEDMKKGANAKCSGNRGGRADST